MDIALLFPLTLAVFTALLGFGRSQLAKGANASVANGSVLMVLATLMGLLALGMMVSLDVW